MSQTVDLNKLEMASRRHFAQDGLLYIFLGLLLLLIGSSFAVPALVGLVGFGALLIFPVEALRRRLTYPRLGYARFPAPPGAVRGILIVALLTAVFLSAMAFAFSGRLQPYLPLAFSLVFALTFYFGQPATGLRPLDWLLVTLSLAAGLVTTLAYSDWHDGAAALFAFMGVVLLLVGTVMLVRFLRRYPPLPGNTLS